MLDFYTGLGTMALHCMGSKHKTKTGTDLQCSCPLFSAQKLNKEQEGTLIKGGEKHIVFVPFLYRLRLTQENSSKIVTSVISNF